MPLGEKMVRPLKRMQRTRHYIGQDVRLDNVASSASGPSNDITDEEKSTTVDDAVAEDENTARQSSGDSDAATSDDGASTDKVPDDEAQAGIQRVEAVTLTWSKRSLITAYILMFLLYFVNAFQASMTGNLTAFVLSGFEDHSLIPVIGIVSNVISAATYLPVAKLCNVWGRPQAFSTMAFMATLGLIIMAVTNNVQTYAAAQIFYAIGFPGMIFSVDVVTADTSSLRDRALAYGFTSSPYIITAFAGPAAAQGFYDNISWRWAFGVFAIILPCVALPFFVLLASNERKARAKGLLAEKKSSGRTWYQSIKHYAIELDALGVVILAAGMVLFLLPFSIAQSISGEWRSGGIIAMLVIGFLLLIAFPFAERYAKRPFVPWHLLLSRNILGTCLLDASWQVAYYCWNSYFSSYLQVVWNLSITEAGWVGGVFDIISGCWLIVVGLLIRKTGRYKWLFLAAVPLYTLGVGLMIHFRMPNQSIGYVIMTQVFIAFAGSTLISCQQVAVLAVAEHQDVASVLALLGLFGYVGGAIGNSISGAIWTNTLPNALRRLLPADVEPRWEAIYGDLATQLSFPMGSPARMAIIESYALAQKKMLIAGTAIMALAMICVFFIRDIRVDRKQMKGMVF